MSGNYIHWLTYNVSSFVSGVMEQLLGRGKLGKRIIMVYGNHGEGNGSSYSRSLPSLVGDGILVGSYKPLYIIISIPNQCFVGFE